MLYEIMILFSLDNHRIILEKQVIRITLGYFVDQNELKQAVAQAAAEALSNGAIQLAVAVVVAKC